MSIRRSLFLSFAQKYSTLALSIPTVMIVSRLLTPAQIGVYSVALAFVNLVHMLRDFGISDFLVQTDQVEDGVAETAFTITLGMGVLLALATLGLSWPLAWFYGEAGLRGVLQILSLNFLLLPFGSVTTALLKRSMRFGALYKIQVSGSAAQSGVSIALAFLGFGYYGLAWGAVANTVVLIAVATVVGRDYRSHGLGLVRWREVGHFGTQRTLGDVIARVGQGAPDFVIGRVIDFTAVGLFSRGKSLVRMFRKTLLNAVGAVTFPTYARDFRNENAPGQLFLRVVTHISGFSWPFLLFTALLAWPIIRVMFGTQWFGAVPVLQFLAIGALVGVLNMDCPQLLTALGRVSTVTRIIALTQAVRLAILVATAFYGIAAVAAGQAVGTLFTACIYYAAVFRYTDTNVADLARALWPSVVSTFVTMAPTAALAWYLGSGPNNFWVPLLACSACAGLFWPLGLWLAGHPLGNECVVSGKALIARFRHRPVWQ